MYLFAAAIVPRSSEQKNVSRKKDENQFHTDELILTRYISLVALMLAVLKAPSLPEDYLLADQQLLKQKLRKK